MQQRLWFALLAFVLACTSTNTASSPDMVERVIRDRDDQERQAALSRNVDALSVLWSDDFTVNAPNNQVVVGKQAVLDTFLRSGVINFSSFERNIEFIRVDGSFAVVMGVETLVPLSDAPSAGLVAGRSVRRRFTNIWKNDRGTWRLYWRHANVIPTR